MSLLKVLFMEHNAKQSHALSRRHLLRWGGTILSLALFLVLLARQDWQAAWRYLSQLSWWVLPLALGFYLLSHLANAWRWQTVLRLGDIALPYWAAVKIVFVGAFASNFLPSTVGGDSVRYLGLLCFTDKKGVGLVSLVVDRALKMLSMLTITPISAALFGPLLWEMLTGKAAAGIAFLPARLRTWAAKGWGVLTLWFKRPGAFLRAFGVGWLSMYPAFVAIWLVARGLHIPVALYHVMGAMVITYFLTLLPISVNGYGVREVLITTLYVPLGATVEQATILAVVTRLLLLFATLPGALWLPEKLALGGQGNGEQVVR
jgi:hypothetical protein